MALLRMDSAIPDPGTAENCLPQYCSLTVHVQAGQQKLHCAHDPKYFATGNRIKECVYVHRHTGLRTHTQQTDSTKDTVVNTCSKHLQFYQM